MSTRARLKTTLKTVAKESLYRAGYYRIQRRVAPSSEKRLVILLYHNLARADGASRREPIDDDSPTPSQFEAHLRVLTRHHRVVSMRDAMAEIRSPDGLGEDSVAVTFDDGSESVYTVAYPLLAKYDVPATVFLVSGWIETGCMSWWQLLCELVEKADLNDATSAQIRDVFGPSVPNLPDTNERDISIRRRFALGVAASLRTMPDRERTDKLDRLQELLFPRGDFVPEDSRVLTWQQIAEMASKRIDFESHSQTHVNIPTADLSTVEEEIRQSKAEIEQHTQREVTGFAYPYGKDLASYVAVEPVLRKHGFTYACNACRGSNSAGSNLYSLYRYSLPLTTSEALIGRELCVFLRRGKPGRD